MKSHGGVTPLMKAAELSNKELVYFLVENGADPTAVDDNGRIARDYAMAAGNINLVDALIYHESRCGDMR